MRDASRGHPRRRADELRVQARPRLVAVALVRIAAGQAGRAARYDERTHDSGVLFEADREVRQVVAQIGRELQCGGGTADHDDGHSARRARIGLVETLIDQRLAQPLLPPPVCEVDAVGPERRCRHRVVHQQRAQGGQQPPCLAARCAHAVRHHVERAEPDARAQPVQQRLDPGSGDIQTHDALEAELHRVLIAPEQRVTRIQTGQRRRRHRAHDPIVS
ncbi:hypothetical protein BFN01_07780 [Microbacterium sp. AR7-10]|nr:hypothetical protein BFN01_07780 [Microbacterium sp. AR7-10]